MKLFGSPPLPLEYFVSHYKSKNSKIFLATHKGMGIIAFLLLFIYNNKIYADINASLPKYDIYFPKVKLYDESIQHACNTGIQTYDFMRTRPNSGVYSHKNKWGGKEIPIYYYYRTYKNKKFPLLDSNQKRFILPKLIFKRLPLEILKIIGPGIRKYAGK